MLNGNPAPLGEDNSVPKPPRLLDQVKSQIRYAHYSRRTEQAYVYWVKAFIRFSGLRHPRNLGPRDVEAFLKHLAVDRSVSGSTHRQALSALLFLYEKVLGTPMEWFADIGRPSTQRRLPVVLSVTEVEQLISALDPQYRLLARLLYGTGMRLQEGLSLRVKDIDFAHNAIVVRDGKGGKDRVVMLPQRLRAVLQEQLASARSIWASDQRAGQGGVYLPDALERKSPRAAETFGWFWVFPANNLSVDTRSGQIRRHHQHEQAFQRAFKRAVRQAGILKAATPHTLRHSFATHLLQARYDIRTVQSLLGHADVRTTMIYTHVLNAGGQGVCSPLDALPG